MIQQTPYEMQMSQYQQQYPQMQMPMQQPQYGMYQPPIRSVNPYQYQQPQQPTQQTSQQTTGLSGRVISDIGEVKANEVPMDGSSSYFVVSDGSAIYRKCWGADGTIFTTRYEPHIEPKHDEVANTTSNVKQPLFDAKTEVLEPIFERISSLEDKLDKMSKPNTTKRGE